MSHYAMNQELKSHDDSITRLVVFLTYRCNFNCSYCYVNKRNSEEFSEEELVKQINKLKQKNTVLREINFMGGEPLLRLNAIKKIIEIFKDEFKYSLNTNGYFLNKEILDFMSKNKVTIILSLDGAETTHNLNRKNKTFNKIVNNVKGYEKDIIINYVINKNSIKNLNKDFNNLVKLGFRKIDVRPNTDYLWKKEELIKLNKEVLKFYYLYFKVFIYPGVRIVLHKIISKKYFYKNEKGCNELMIGPDGYLFSCCKLCNAYQDTNMNFGKLTFDFKKRGEFLTFARKEIQAQRGKKMCSKCSLKNYCLCMIDTYYLHKDNFNLWFDAYCKINKIMIGNLFRVRNHFLRKNLILNQ